MTTKHDELGRLAGAGARHRPQTLVFSFFGGLVLDRDVPPIPTGVFLRVLGDLGVAEAAARATLARMARKSLLERTRTGRVTHYRLTLEAEALLGRAAERVRAPAPFAHPDGQWTLLSYSMPESRRDLRHKLRATLAWAGFGGLRDGLWIAPGTIDVATVFAEAGLEEVTGLAEWFAASPMSGVDVAALVGRAWPVEEIRARHDSFLSTWRSAPSGDDPLSQVTLLGADWLRVLQADPGLPADFLPRGWPAAESAAVYHRRFDAVIEAARETLDRRVGTGPAGPA